MHFSAVTFASLALLASTATARIISISAPATVKAGSTFQVTFKVSSANHLHTFVIFEALMTLSF